ncbi:uncharacterized protein LOC133911036 [Phragmites australis]|uniref:uncharacterized protein LOC133911036 n=1 Tax=Phragmites australis TaxID=29695 RepID=UPI002D7675AE|nr:uncharacterized protein LOC133911036 [Phragmites australis]
MSSEAAESSRAGQVEESGEEKAGWSRQRPWVALVSVPVVVSNEDEQAQKILPGTDVLLDFQDPPRPSYLVLPERIVPDPKFDNCFPYIVATHPSGRLIFHATQSRGNLNTAYFLCDAHSRTATRLPDVPVSQLRFNLRPRRSIGLIAYPRRTGHYIVAQLHPTSSTRHDTLLYYSTHTHEWAVKRLASSPDHKPWGAHGVFSHDGMLWWVDVAYGMLTCDPFADLPHLRFVPLPFGSEMDDAVVHRVFLDQRRCVRPSEGKLRYVEIRGLPLPHDPTAAVSSLPDYAAVCMWTLVDPEGPNHWEFEYEAPFSEIWADEGYIKAGLPPQKVPALALVHPNNHAVVYFFHGTSLFAVDMRARRVLDCEECLIDHHLQLQFQTSRFVDAWELPPTLLRIDPSAAGMEGPEDGELSMTDLMWGSDEELASLMSQMELKSQADEELSLVELMNMLKDLAPSSESSPWSSPSDASDQADEP